MFSRVRQKRSAVRALFDKAAWGKIQEESRQRRLALAQKQTRRKPAQVEVGESLWFLRPDGKKFRKDVGPWRVERIVDDSIVQGQWQDSATRSSRLCISITGRTAGSEHNYVY